MHVLPLVTVLLGSRLNSRAGGELGNVEWQGSGARTRHTTVLALSRVRGKKMGWLQKYSGHLNIKLDENNTSTEVSKNERYKTEPKKDRTKETQNWHALPVQT